MVQWIHKLVSVFTQLYLSRRYWASYFAGRHRNKLILEVRVAKPTPRTARASKKISHHLHQKPGTSVLSLVIPFFFCFRSSWPSFHSYFDFKLYHNAVFNLECSFRVPASIWLAIQYYCIGQKKSIVAKIDIGMFQFRSQQYLLLLLSTYTVCRSWIISWTSRASLQLKALTSKLDSAPSLLGFKHFRSCINA